MDPVTIAYIKLIYEKKYKTSQNLNHLRFLLFKKTISLENAKLIMIGDSSLVNIFVFAFY